jgi:GNAT superfamily N-acetyltransferase
MATEPQARGRGAGSAVLQALLDHAQAHNAQLVCCNARVPALALYERAGFVAASDPFEVAQIGPHVVMEWRPGSARLEPMGRREISIDQAGGECKTPSINRHKE